MLDLSGKRVVLHVFGLQQNGPISWQHKIIRPSYIHGCNLQAQLLQSHFEWLKSTKSPHQK